MSETEYGDTEKFKMLETANLSPPNSQKGQTPESTRPPTGSGTRPQTGRPLTGSRRPSSAVVPQEEKSGETQEITETRQKLFAVLDGLWNIKQEGKFPREEIGQGTLPELVDILDRKIADLLQVGVFTKPVQVLRSLPVPKVAPNRRSEELETKIASLSRTVQVQRQALTRRFFGEKMNACSGACEACCALDREPNRTINERATEFTSERYWCAEEKRDESLNESTLFFKSLMPNKH